MSIDYNTDNNNSFVGYMALLQSLIDSRIEAVLVVDSCNQTAFANKHFFSLWGFYNFQKFPLDLNDIWSKLAAASLQFPLLKSVLDEAHQQLRYLFTRQDGQDISCQCEPLVLANQQLGFIFTFRLPTFDQLDLDELELAKVSIAQSSDAMHWVAPDGRYIHVNDASCRLLGYTRKELLNMTVFDVNPRFHRNSWDAHWQRVKKEGSVSFETLVNSKSGTSIPVEIRVGYVYLNGKEYQCANLRDISERKRAQEELERREEFLRLSQQVAHVGSWDWDIPNNRIEWSAEMSRLHGQDPDTYVPTLESALSFYHPEDREHVVSGIKRSLESGWNEPRECKIVLSDGAIRVVWVNWRTYHDANGVPIRMIGANLDITERKRAEEEIRSINAELEQRVEQRTEDLADALELTEGILSSTKLGICAYRQNGECIFSNQTIVSIVGAQSIVQILQLNFWENKTWERYGLLDLAKEALATGERRSTKLFIVSTFKKELWLDCTFSIFTREGEPHLLVMATDVTESQTAEEALRQSQATAIRAREEAERASRAKSEFLSSMSHELRTPMNAILGFAQLMQIDVTLTRDQQDNVSEILNAGQHLLALIEEVLDLSRIESGNMRLVLESLSCNAVFEDCFSIIESMATHKGIFIYSEISQEYLVRADRIKLKQVIINLLSNAIKYNTKGGSVTVSTDLLLDGRIKICVADTGIGIDFNKQSQVFEPFNRLGVDGAVIEGTGIGLVISRRLIEMMEGEIGFSSTPGLGSTFWIILASATEGSVQIENLFH